MIDKAHSSISELYRLHEFVDDAKRLVAINDLLERNTFAVRDSDRVGHGVSPSVPGVFAQFLAGLTGFLATGKLLSCGTNLPVSLHQVLQENPGPQPWAS